MKKSKIASRLDNDEHEEAMHQEELLLKVWVFLKRHRAGKQLIEAIEFELIDNEQWINKDLLEKV